ncbi:MAG: hypothetical protein JXB07_08395, partial [Anaerolineae bacterium]|nr:hypothetical protein [Anaerolineae bacterium]
RMLPWRSMFFCIDVAHKYLAFCHNLMNHPGKWVMAKQVLCHLPRLPLTFYLFLVPRSLAAKTYLGNYTLVEEEPETTILDHDGSWVSTLIPIHQPHNPCFL